MSISQNFPAIRPTLSLNFARSKTLDPRITFTRASTATYVDREGIIRTAAVDQARFDHDPATGESLGLLIEESRTNLVTYSTNLTQWPPANNVTYSLSNVLSPDGESYAYEMKENTANFYHAGYPNGISLDGSSKYTISAWLKRGSNYRTDIANGTFQLYCSRGSGSVAYIILNSDFNTIVSHSNTDSRSLTLYPNGWAKVTYTFTSNAAANVTAHFLFGGGGSYVGDGASNVYIWGVQVEKGSFATSYIPTSGSAVTRSADLASISGSSFSNFYNPNGGTAYIDLISQGVNEGGTPFQVYFNFNSDASNRWGISHQNESRDSYASNAVLPYVGQAGVFDVLTRFSKTFVPGSRNKYAMTQPNGSDVKIIGTGTGGFTSGITSKVPATSQLYLGQVISDNGNLSGTIAEFRYYPQELTPDQITTLIK